MNILDSATLNTFTGKANQAFQCFEVWFNANNQFAKNAKEWDLYAYSNNLFVDTDTTIRGCRYKNFWPVVTASLQHSWILGIARLVDKPYFEGKPRISIYYILDILADKTLVSDISMRLEKHHILIKSIRKLRNDALAHNDAKFNTRKI